ncbi:hypothetical protein ABPG72_012587 [Tetrahymena utriculariae]
MGNCQNFVNMNDQRKNEVVNQQVSIESPEQKQNPGFQKRPIGVQAPLFSGMCLFNGGFQQKSLKDYSGKYLVILFYSFEEEQTYNEIFHFSQLNQEFQSRNCDIIIIIDEKLERIKSQIEAYSIKKLQASNSQQSPQNEVNTPTQNDIQLNLRVFGDSEGKIFKNFKVPTTDSNKCYRYKALFVIDKLGIIQYLNIQNSNIKCDPKSVLQILMEVSSTPLNMQLSLFERIGGARVIVEAVEVFYSQLPNNPFLNEFFKNINIRSIKSSQAEYLNYLFRLPLRKQTDLKLYTTFNGKNISESHKNINIQPNIFEIYIYTFCSIFAKLDVDPLTIQEIYQRFQFVKPLLFPNLKYQRSTYELLGCNQDLINQFIDRLYQRVFSDEQIGHFFKGVEINKFKQTQAQFFTLAFGGRSSYEPLKLKESHAHLKLTDHHFETYVDYICQSLLEMSISQDQIELVRKQFQMLRNYFVTNSIQNSTYNNLLQSSVYHSQHNKDSFEQTLYYRLGGKQIVDQIFSVLQKKIQADPRINYIFSQQPNQMDFYEQIQIAMGGQIKQKNPSQFVQQNSSNLNQSQFQNGNALIKINEMQYGQLKLHLLHSSRSFQIDFDKIVEIGQVYESLRGIVFNIIPLKTIYEQFGGENSVQASVNIFYDKLQYDHRLNILFKTIPVAKQKELFYNLISYCVGSPNQYDSAKMKASTFELHMRDIHYEGLEQNLISTLKDMMQSDKDIQNAVHVLQTIKGDLIIPIASLFDEVGGDLVVDQAIDRFYTKLNNNENLQKMFQFLDRDSQTSKLKTYVKQLFGGPQNYNGRNMQKAHYHLGINDSQFDKFKVLLNQSFGEVGVKIELLPKISFKLETLRVDIVDSRQSKFNRLGGEKFLGIAVDLFYQKVMRDERIHHFFDKIDIKHQKQMMAHFLSVMLGADETYKGKNMREAHQHLELNNLHFDVFKAILMDTLIELDVDFSLIDQIENEHIEPLRKEIIIHIQSPNYNYF